MFLRDDGRAPLFSCACDERKYVNLEQPGSVMAPIAVGVEVAMIFQLRPTTTGASLRWHRDVSWVCGSCTATPGASRRRKTQVPARVLCLSGSCRLSHAEKHGSQRAKGAAVPARAGQMKVSHVWEFSRARSASRRTRTGPHQPLAWAHLGTGLHLSHFCRRYTNVPRA